MNQTSHRLQVPSQVDPLVARVAACALGLAFAERTGPDGVREVQELAQDRRDVLVAARQRLAGLDVADEVTAVAARRLLSTAAEQIGRPTLSDAQER